MGIQTHVARLIPKLRQHEILDRDLREEVRVKGCVVMVMEDSSDVRPVARRNIRGGNIRHSGQV